mgnify:CR=1 FL=1
MHLITESMYINVHEDTCCVIGRKRPRSAISEVVAPEAKKRRVSISVVPAPATTKKVAFAPSTVVIAIDSSADTWYNVSDYDSFKKNMKRDVVYMAKLCQQRPTAGRTVEADLEDYCYIGLEKYCCPRADREESRSMKQQRVQAVLEAQQQNQSDECIRECAQQFSQKAVAHALKVC